jgi:hypothetical protein
MQVQYRQSKQARPNITKTLAQGFGCGDGRHTGHAAQPLCKTAAYEFRAINYQEIHGDSEGSNDVSRGGSWRCQVFLPPPSVQVLAIVAKLELSAPWWAVPLIDVQRQRRPHH